jgi:hypothetical protein
MERHRDEQGCASHPAASGRSGRYHQPLIAVLGRDAVIVFRHNRVATVRQAVLPQVSGQWVRRNHFKVASYYQYHGLPKRHWLDAEMLGLPPSVCGQDGLWSFAATGKSSNRDGAISWPK